MDPGAVNVGDVLKTTLPFGSSATSDEVVVPVVMPTGHTPPPVVLQLEMRVVSATFPKLPDFKMSITLT